MVVVPEKEQKALVVTGVIKDKAGAPLPGATIVVKWEFRGNEYRC